MTVMAEDNLTRLDIRPEIRSPPRQRQIKLSQAGFDIRRHCRATVAHPFDTQVRMALAYCRDQISMCL